MKSPLLKLLLWYILVAIFMIGCAVVFSSCTTSKHITENKQQYDSSKEKELLQSVAKLQSENERLKAENAELQYAGVTFNEEDNCPPTQITIDSSCNVDSVQRLLENQLSKRYENKIKILADGTIEAQGNLKSANYKLSKFQSLLKESSRRNDSLIASLQKEKQTEKIVTVEKEKIVKKGWPWWLLAACFIAGCIVWNYTGGKIKAGLSKAKHIFSSNKSDMKLPLYILAAIACMALTGCVKFHDEEKSVWAEGLWILPWVTGLSSLFFFWLAYRSQKSGSTINPVLGGGDGGKMPIWQLGKFWFGVALAVATTVIIISVISNR